MTREDVERLLHCARHEAQGAGPNTLGEVCEWALAAEVETERLKTGLGMAEADLWSAERRVELAEAKLEEVRRHGMHENATCTMLAARLNDAEAKLAKAREALRVICAGKAHEDNRHPLGEYASMAFRFHNIARAALTENEATP